MEPDVKKFEKVVSGYEDRIARQRARIDAMMSYLQETGQVEAFNQWEESKRV